MEKLSLESSYQQFLTEVKKGYQFAQLKTAEHINANVVEFYWRLGKRILEREVDWTARRPFVSLLAKDLLSHFPHVQGFSSRNLEFMRQFALLYPHLLTTQQSISQLPWGHIIALIHRVRDPSAREWYARNTIKHGIPRHILIRQIEQNIYIQQKTLVKNLAVDTTENVRVSSDLALQLLKSPYNFDFLMLGTKAHAREVKAALASCVCQLLLDLGLGFALIGQHYKILSQGKDYHIDILFYHIKLQCYMVIQLSTEGLTPEDVAKMNIYLAAVDNFLKTSALKPSIGLLIGKTGSKYSAQYVLNQGAGEVGLSTYQLVKRLPKNLATLLPTIAEIEAEVMRDKSQSLF